MTPEPRPKKTTISLTREEMATAGWACVAQWQATGKSAMLPDPWLKLAGRLLDAERNARLRQERKERQRGAA